MGLFKSHNTTTRENKISDFTVSTAQYGASVCEILGTTRISPNVIYWDDFTAHEHKSSQKSGKGGHSKTTTITYTYTVAVILALCEGEITGIGKMWKGKNIYQYPNGNVGLTLFPGTPDQKPWAYVQGKHPNKALAYENLAYMAGVIDLGDSGSMPDFNFEVKGKLLDTGDGIDVNPADYILYVLNKVGLGGVKIDGIDNYRHYCKEADFLISTPSDSTDAKSAREIVKEIANITNAYFFWSNDCFKIVPRADRAIGSWKPDKTIRYNLTPDDFIPQSGGACITYSRKDSSEIYNRISVEFLNRSNGYEKEIVNYQDNDDIKEFGVRQASTTNAHYIYTKTRAVRLAEELYRKNKYERVKYTFKLDWAFCRLEPGDLVMLNDPLMGIEHQPAMIDSVTEGKDGVLTFTAISRARGVYSAAEYDVHENERPLIDFNPDSGNVEPPAIFQPPAQMTSVDNEVWIGTWGKNPNWGGCSVWASDTNQYFRKIGTIDFRARYGTLAKDLTRYDDSLEMTLNQGEFTSVDAQAAENGDTVMYIDGEALSYTTAELLENGNWRLSGLVRGQYGSEATYHSANTQISRCDEAFIQSGVPDAYIGQTIYFKFTSFNTFREQEQDLAEVRAYTFKPVSVKVPPPDVEILNVEKLATGTRRYWWKYTYPEPNDMAGFVLKYTQGDELNWDTGIPVQEGLITSQPFETETVRQGVHAVMIKAVDEDGLESRNFAYCVLDIGELLAENVLATCDFSENRWAATKHTGEVRSDGYVHVIDTESMWPDLSQFQWRKDSAAAMWGNVYSPYDLYGEWESNVSGQMWIKSDITGPAAVYYRKVLNNSMWSAEDAAEMWDVAETAPMWKLGQGEELWKQYADRVLVDKNDVIQVWVHAINNSVEATVIKGLQVNVDVPDRNEHFEDLAISKTGTVLPIVTPHYKTTAVHLDAIQGAAVDFRIVSRTPCIIKLVDNAGNAVNGVADVSWQGYEEDI